MNVNPFRYGRDTLTAGTLLEMLDGKRHGIIDDKARKRIDVNKAAVEKIVADGKIVYGVNTGFGPLCNTLIGPEDTRLLQENILRSHSVGMGENIPEDVARLMMILKVHALAQGYSGINITTLERIIWFIDMHFTPVVPSQGSVGASGDLAPLSHLFLPLIGLGEVMVEGKITDTADVLKRHKLKPLNMEAKEGLALINGTQFMAAWGVRGLARMKNALDAADIIGAMTLEALAGSVKPFRPELHEIRPYEGTKLVARRLRTLLESSEILASHINCERVQDPYSLRCMPQVHGASRNAWSHLKDILSIEINAVTDNPVILDADNAISGGNFHGQPIAIPMDYAAIAAAELGNISDRRTYLLLEGKVEGLPKLLMKRIGINSGFMIPQYTSAALVSENKGLCFPASCDSIPTSLGQEDHVSMGSISARKLNKIIDNLENILSVEMVSAAQAFDFRRPLKSSPILEACHNMIREHIHHAEKDRVFAIDLNIGADLIKDGILVRTANEAANHSKIDLDGESHERFSLS